MLELYENLNFKANPFSKFSAEEEIGYIDKIYFEPKYFKTLYDDIRQNNSRFIFGERGSGKSALMYKIISQIKEENHLFILVDNFSFLTKVTSFKDYEIVFTKQLLKALMARSLDNKKIYKNLEKIDKEKLAFIISHFFETVSQREFKSIYKFCQASKTSNLLKQIYNRFFNRLLNQLLSGAVVLTSDTVSKSLGLPNPQNEKFYREYLPSFNEDDICPKDSKDFQKKILPEQMNHIFNDLTNIINKLGFKTTIVFIDKVDETSEVKGNVQEIGQYLLHLLTENRLILNGDFAFVFMLWNKLKPELENKGVRFDKIKPVDVTWNSEELMSILNKRLFYYSESKVKSLKDIFEDPEDVQIILKLANGSPRDLISVLSSIYDQQQEINSNSKFLSSLAFKRGIKKFLEMYNYYAQYPPTKSAKQDIKIIIAKLRNMGKLQFYVKDVAASLKILPQAASSYIRIWSNYGIISEIHEMAGQTKMYTIDDPKIEYIIREKIIISK